MSSRSSTLEYEFLNFLKLICLDSVLFMALFHGTQLDFLLKPRCISQKNSGCSCRVEFLEKSLKTDPTPQASKLGGMKLSYEEATFRDFALKSAHPVLILDDKLTVVLNDSITAVHWPVNNTNMVL